MAAPLAVVLLAAFLWPRSRPGGHADAALGRRGGGHCWAASLTLLGPPAWLSRLWSAGGHQPRGLHLVLGASTFLIPRNPDDRYDPDTTWTLGLPLAVTNGAAGRGPRNLVVWWEAMLAATVAGWLVFPEAGEIAKRGARNR